MSSSGMTDTELHEALLAAAMRSRSMSDADRSTVLDEMNRHKPKSGDRVGCRPAPWRDCPVITHYAHVYEVDLRVAGVRAHSRPV